MKTFRALAIAALMLRSASMLTVYAEDLTFYVGTYTNAGSKGIYHYKLNTSTGALSGGEVAAEAKNPTFLALHPNGKFLYAALENGNGAVASFRIQPDKALQPLNEQSSKGGAACHVSVDGTGKNVLVANYSSGNVAAFQIKEDGSLSEVAGFAQHTGSSIHPERQQRPHAHFIDTDAASRFAYVCDLGLDKVLVYRFDAKSGALVPNSPSHAEVAPGSGPRHLAFHPTQNYIYVINELSNTVTAFRKDESTGGLEVLQTIATLPAGFKGESTTAEIAVHPSGKYLYGSNRGHDSIVVFSIDEQTGKLELVEHVSTKGRTPRNFALEPSGAFLLVANQESNDIHAFRVDAASGKLTPTGSSVKCIAPVCIRFIKEVAR